MRGWKFLLLILLLSWSPVFAEDNANKFKEDSPAVQGEQNRSGTALVVGIVVGGILVIGAAAFVWSRSRDKEGELTNRGEKQNPAPPQ